MPNANRRQAALAYHSTVLSQLEKALVEMMELGEELIIGSRTLTAHEWLSLVNHIEILEDSIKNHRISYMKIISEKPCKEYPF